MLTEAEAIWHASAHEAGHIVAAAALGIAPESIVIVPPPAISHCLFAGNLMTLAPEDIAMISVAGTVGAVILAPGIEPDQAAPPDGNDGQAMDAMLSAHERWTGQRIDAHTWMKRATKRAVELLIAHQFTLYCLALKASRLRVLNSNEITATLKAGGLIGDSRLCHLSRFAPPLAAVA